MSDTALTTPHAHLQPGDLASPDGAGRFVLTGELARGGMGVVYAALDPQFGREVAVKVLHESLAGGTEGVRRFDAEAQITAHLQHPNVPPVFERGTLADGRPWLAMKLVRGKTLAAILAGDGPRPDLVAVFEAVCQAVAFAHSRGVIHRDLKPQNVMVGEYGEVQVMDWGLAKMLGDPDADHAASSQIDTLPLPHHDGGTRPGAVLGTAAYMPPEQADGRVGEVDRRADVFGLGGVLAVVLTGHPPYPAGGGGLEACHVRLDLCDGEPPLVALAKHCLAASPKDRPADAGVVAARVGAIRREADERARRAEADRERRGRRTAQALLAASVLGLAAVVSFGAWAWRLTDRVLAEREQRVRDGVGEVFGRLPEIRARGLWTQAEAALDQAERLLDEEEYDLLGRVRRAKRETALAKRLDEIRLRKSSALKANHKFDLASAHPLYAAAFREAGLDVLGPDADAVAREIADSAIRDEILAALDDWAGTAKADERVALFALTARATGQAWRDALMAAWADPAKLNAAFAAVPHRERSAALTAAVGYRLGKGAAPLLEEALLHRPDDFWLHLDLALQYPDDPHKQIGAYRAAVALRPNVAVAWNNLGAALRETKDHAAARACFREAVRLGPNSWMARINLAISHEVFNDNEAALAEAREAIRIEPTLVLAHTFVGELLFKKKDLAGASAALREACHHGPTRPEPRVSLNMVLLAAKDLKGAAEAAEEAVRLGPDDAGSHNARGLSRREAGDVRGAVAAFREAVRLAPANAITRNNLGAALGRVGEEAESLVHFREAARLDPSNDESCENLGRFSETKADAALAVPILRKAAEVAPKNPGAHRGLGLALGNVGDHAGAVAAHREAVKLAPALDRGHLYLGLALVEIREYAAAAVAFRDAIRLGADRASVYANLGDAASFAGDDGAAVAAFEVAAKREPMNAAYAKSLAAARARLVLSRRLPAIRAGTELPKDPADAVALALFACQPCRREYGVGYRLFRSALEEEPRLALPNFNRLNAACAAVRLATGGDVVDRPDGRRARSLRGEALTWLRDELADCRRLAASPSPAAKARAAQGLAAILGDDDVARVRAAAVLEGMSDAERSAWDELWRSARDR